MKYYKVEITYRPDDVKNYKFFWAVYKTDDILCPKSWITLGQGGASTYSLAMNHARQYMRGVCGNDLL